MNKKVSILIPLYNSEKWIDATIQSILDQSYQNIELIVVDDGSTDNSVNIVKQFDSEKLKIIQQENKGACAARNKAFELSSGDYIIYFDADDLMSEDKITNQVELASKYGNDFIYSSQWIPFEDDLNNLPYTKSPIDKDFDDVLDWFKISWEKNHSAQTGIWMTPRKLIEKSGRWDETLKVNQDGEFFFRVLLNSKGIKFTEESFVYYRREVYNSISKSMIPERAKSMLNSYIKYEKVLSVDDSDEIKRALAYNYARFIYIFHPAYPDLINLAWERINNLGVSEKWNIGGNNFKRMSKYFGFNSALKLRETFKK